MASGFFIIFLVLVAAIGGPIAAHFLGHGPNDIFFTGVNNDLLPVGPWTHIDDTLHPGHQTLFVLGADGTLGRDEFLRLLYGARVSLEVAVLSTIGVMTIGIIMGVVAGYFRGWIDASHLADHRGHDGVPGAALHHRPGGDDRGAAEQHHASGSSARAS